MADQESIFTAKYVLGRICPKDIVQYADKKLGQGFYSEAYLNIVDANIETMAVLAPLLEEAFKASGAPIPTLEEAAWIMLRHHIGIIAEGDSNPRKQFSMLLNDINSFDLRQNIEKYVGDNVGIANLYGLYHDDYATEAEIDLEFVKESRIWMGLYGYKP